MFKFRLESLSHTSTNVSPLLHLLVLLLLPSFWHVSHFGLLLSRDKCQITWCSIFIRSTLTGRAYSIKAWWRSSHWSTHIHIYTHRQKRKQADTRSYQNWDVGCKVPPLISPFLLFLITLVTHMHGNTHMHETLMFLAPIWAHKVINNYVLGNCKCFCG